MKKQSRIRISYRQVLIFITIFLFFFFISTTDTFAANRYWVGGTNGADYNSTANWASADPASCTGGGASVPGSSDAVIFDADCDNGITISGNWTVSTVSAAAGYAGTITQNTATTWTVNSTFTNSSSASVYSGSGTATVKLDNTGRAPTITTGGITFNNLTLYTGESYSTEATTFADNFTVAGTLTVSSVSTCCTTHTWSAGSAKTITLQGNYSQSYSGTVSIFGNSNLTLMMTGANKSFTVTGGTFAGNLTVNGTGTTTISKAGNATAGTFTASSTVALSGHSTFYNFNINNGVTFDSSNDGGTTSYNTTIRNNMTNQTGAIFTGRAGTVTFSHTGVSPTITTGGVTFNNVVMTSSDASGSYSTTIADSFTVAGNLTTQLVSGSSGTHTWVGASSLKTITVQGNYSQSLSGSNSYFTFGNSYIAITMTGTDKTISVPSGTFAGTMNINPASGSIALAANSILSGTFVIKSGKTFDMSPDSGVNVYNLTIKNTMTNESGAVFTARTGTVTFDHSGVSPTITTAGITFNNVTLTSGTGENSQNLTTTFADSFTIAGNLTIQSVAATNSTHIWTAASTLKTITLQGNYSHSQSSGSAVTVGSTNLLISMTGADKTFTVTSGTFNGRLTFSGTGTTVVSKAGTAGTSEVDTINQTSGSVSLSANSTFYALTVATGTLDINGKNLTANSIAVNSAGILQLQGGETVSVVPTLNTGSTVVYNDPTTARTIKTTWSHKNLTINSASTTNVFSLGANTTGLATTTITSGVLSLAGYNATTTVLVNEGKLKLQGNESLVITTMDTDSGTVEYAGRNIAENLNIKDFGTADYYNLTINDANTNKATFVAPATFRVNGALTVTSGTLNGASSALTLGGTDQTVTLSATTTFQTVTKSVSATSTLTFSNSTSTPLIITATTTLGGVTDGWLSLRSTASGTPWFFDPQGVRSLSYLDVQDSYNLNALAIDATADGWFVDSGRNTNWTFASLASAVVTVGKSGTQIATTSMPVTNQELGGAFTLNATGGAPDITAIKIKQIGSLATTSITNVELFYKEEATCSATSTPLDATSFGVAEAFDENSMATTTGSLTLTDGVQTCLYIQYDLPDTYSSSTLGRSIDFEITNPATDITVDGGAVTTSAKINITGRTIVTTTDVVSMLSLKSGPEAGDVTVYYLQNDAVWKMVNGGTPTRLTNANLKVHSLTFTDLTVGSDLRTVQIQMVISNVDQGAPDSYLNVTRTYTTTATVKTWGGN